MKLYIFLTFFITGVINHFFLSKIYQKIILRFSNIKNIGLPNNFDKLTSFQSTVYLELHSRVIYLYY